MLGMPSIRHQQYSTAQHILLFWFHRTQELFAAGARRNLRILITRQNMLSSNAYCAPATTQTGLATLTVKTNDSRNAFRLATDVHARIYMAPVCIGGRSLRSSDGSTALPSRPSLVGDIKRMGGSLHAHASLSGLTAGIRRPPPICVILYNSDGLCPSSLGAE